LFIESHPTHPEPLQKPLSYTPEQLEEIPYPFGMAEVASGTNWPPAGFSGVTDMTTTSTNTASLLPEAYNLEWVQGDTAEFQFLFTDVNWTHVDPEDG